MTHYLHFATLLRMYRPVLQELPPKLRELLQDELRPDEKLVWSGPAIPRLWSAGTIAPVLFAIPWTAFAIFWTVGAATATRSTGGSVGGGIMSSAFRLFGVPFILIGIAMLSTPLWTRRTLRNTVYAITDRRAISASINLFGTRKVQSFEPSRLTSMQRRQRADGSGDLIFEEFTTRVGSGTNTVRRGFFSVADVAEVENVIRDTLLKERVRTIADD